MDRLNETKTASSPAETNERHARRYSPEQTAARVELTRKWKLANKERVRESERRYREKNRDQIRQKAETSRSKNREAIRDYDRSWREQNREKIREKQKEYRAANRAQIQQRQRKWATENKDALADKRRVNSAKNRDTISARQQRWYMEQKDVVRNRRRQRAYGVSDTEWFALFAAQDCRCAICETDKPGHQDWATDHCHTTGRVRGVLCSRCNAGLGMFKDNPASLLAAAAYLFKSEEDNQ